MSKKLIKKSKIDVKKVSAISRQAFIRSPGKGDDFVVVKNLTLYRYVYSSTSSFLCVLVLFASFLMQGFYVASADEIEPSSIDSITVSESSDSEDPETDYVETESKTTEEYSDEDKMSEIDSGKPTVNETNDLEIIENEKIETEENLESVPVEIDEAVIIDTENSTTTGSDSNIAVNPSFETAEEVIDSSNQTSTTSEAQTSIPSEEEEVVVEEGDGSVVATTSLGVATTTHESISFVQSDNAITFSKDDCIKLEDSSFYCREIENDHLEDSLFSARDQDGDLEIFLIRDGKQAQITENQVDDASPYFDSVSNTLVWQRLIDDRFQIISYDIESGEEIQITDGTVNNMQPTRQGQYTVWQSWINDSWNVILYDGTIEKELTNDLNHNLAPHIQGSLVIWNKTSLAGEKTIEMYNIDSGAYVTVNDPDGLTVDNPRMVLVYDSLHPNGDIVTKGFDIFSGEFIQLDTLPKSLPEIPDSETTTEIKALIQPKPELKLNLENKLPDDDFDNNVTTDLDLSVVTEVATSTEMTLDLSQSTTTESVSSEEIQSIPDLIISPFTESASSTGTSTSGV